MKATAITDIGKTRAVNQDYIYTSVDRVGCLPNLFIVADGMGGHKAGDTASRFTVETIKTLIEQSQEKDAISVINDSHSNSFSQITSPVSPSIFFILLIPLVP